MGINIEPPVELNHLLLPKSSELVPVEEHIQDKEGLVQPEIYTFDFENEDYRRFILFNLGRLAVRTREAAAERAKSYRGFTLGVTAVAIDMEASRLGIFTEGNVKNDKNDPTNCGELNTEIPIVEFYRMERIAAFFIAATSNVEKIKEVNQVPARTLHPCKNCGIALKRSREVDNETLLLSFGKVIDIAQFMTVKEYNALYATFRKTGNVKDYKDPQAYKLRTDDDEGAFLAESYSRSVRRQSIGGGEFHGDKKRVQKRNQELADTITRESIHFR